MVCYIGYTWEAGVTDYMISNHLRHKGPIFSTNNSQGRFTGQYIFKAEKAGYNLLEEEAHG